MFKGVFAVKIKRIILALLLFLMAPLTAAAAQVTVDRDLPAQAEKGQIVSVSLEMDVNESNAPILVAMKEFVLPGWEASNIGHSGYFLSSAGEIRWVFFTGDVVDSTITYNLHIPQDASGEYTINGSIIIPEGTTLEDSKIMISSQDISSSPSGGGGGGGGAATPKITVTTSEGKAEIKIDFLPANKETTVTIPDTENMPFASLGINVNKKVSDVEMTITTLDEKPENISADISGKVKDYIQIDTDVKDADINNVTNAFKVPLSWIEDNNIDKEQVALNRYADDKWNTLTTTKSSEDSDYVYYSTTSPGFSYFGISGQVAEEAPATTMPPMTTTARPTTAPPTTAPATTAPPVTTAPPKEKKGICGPSAVLLTMVLPPFLYGLRTRKRR